jgi:hypothetical protein
MTYSELSQDLFYVGGKTSTQLFMVLKEWPVIPAGINECEDANLDTTTHQVWADQSRKVVYIYWPEFAIAMNDLVVDQEGHKNLRDIVLKVHRGRDLTDEELQIWGDALASAPLNKVWKTLEAKIAARRNERRFDDDNF